MEQVRKYRALNAERINILVFNRFFANIRINNTKACKVMRELIELYVKHDGNIPKFEKYQEKVRQIKRSEKGAGKTLRINKFPIELHEKFKACCRAHKRKMTEEVRALLYSFNLWCAEQ